MCSVTILLVDALGSLTANHRCLESKITRAGVRSMALINALEGIVGSAHRIDLAC